MKQEMLPRHASHPPPPNTQASLNASGSPVYQKWRATALWIKMRWFTSRTLKHIFGCFSNLGCHISEHSEHSEHSIKNDRRKIRWSFSIWHPTSFSPISPMRMYMGSPAAICSQMSDPMSQDLHLSSLEVAELEKTKHRNGLAHVIWGPWGFP